MGGPAADGGAHPARRPRLAHLDRRPSPLGRLDRTGPIEGALSGGHLLLWVDEWERSRRADPLAVVGFDLESVARRRKGDRHPHVADVLLQARRPTGIGDVSDATAAVRDRPVLRGLVDRVSFDLDADELARDALAPDPLERRLADVVGDLRLDPSRAMSRPRSVTCSSSPSLTRCRYDRKLSRNSLIPTSTAISLVYTPTRRKVSFTD